MLSDESMTWISVHDSMLLHDTVLSEYLVCIKTAFEYGAMHGMAWHGTRIIRSYIE